MLKSVKSDLFLNCMAVSIMSAKLKCTKGSKKNYDIVFFRGLKLHMFFQLKITYYGVQKNLVKKS